MDLKNILKTIKLHEQEISTLFGVIILIIAGLIAIRYIKNLRRQSLDNQVVTERSVQTHIVAKGETLWSISQTYFKDGFAWKKIADANNITNPSKIEVGQKLVIPQENVVTPEPKKEETPIPQITKEAASTNNLITGEKYTVIRGDSLWKIAVRAYGDGHKWVQIARENKIKNPNLIHSGNVFIIPR